MNLIRTAVIVAVAADAVCAAHERAGGQGECHRQVGCSTSRPAAGSGTPTMTFTQDGEKLTGKYQGQFGEADLTGTVKGQDIAFSFNVDAQGTAVTFKYTGTIENKDALKGKVEIVGLGEGTFTAKRQ